MELKSKTVLITGAGRGLGRALAFALASRGARIGLIARSETELLAVERDLRARGHEVHAVIADVADKESVYPAVGQIAQKLGSIDILINNASALGTVPLRLLIDTDCEELEATFATNLLGPFRFTKAVLGSMIARKQGAIINISSDAAVNPYPTWGPYSASKAALDHLTRILAEELAHTKLKLLSIDPGEMNTRMHAEAIPEADPATLADPHEVALIIARLIENLDSVHSGSRIVAQSWARENYESRRPA
jgi:NAD(P)-dependent dehydrogenase (short-subunit alcohol dehydrogenase family)